jgi:hypothetical protein
MSLDGMSLRYVATRPSALIPIVMSFVALAVLLLALSFGLGVSNDGDEGAAAHIWQLLMIGQLPVVAFFAFQWVPKAPAYAVMVMLIQFLAALSSLGPVFVLGL